MIVDWDDDPDCKREKKEQLILDFSSKTYRKAAYIVIINTMFVWRRKLNTANLDVFPA
jgi:hypothetical protein